MNLYIWSQISDPPSEREQRVRTPKRMSRGKKSRSRSRSSAAEENTVSCVHFVLRSILILVMGPNFDHIALFRMSMPALPSRSSVGCGGGAGLSNLSVLLDCSKSVCCSNFDKCANFGLPLGPEGAGWGRAGRVGSLLLVVGAFEICF